MARLLAQVEATHAICQRLLPWLPAQTAGSADRCLGLLADAHEEARYLVELYALEMRRHAERGVEDEAA